MISTVPVLSKFPVEFEFTKEAATHDISLFKEVGYNNLRKFIKEHLGSTITTAPSFT